ncbi:MAG: sel1 repeat family protein [Verrucomicrobiota bacterium]|nr:sel1 repeat family protein [Verrucomicrobiota bacterium]
MAISLRCCSNLKNFQRQENALLENLNNPALAPRVAGEWIIFEETTTPPSTQKAEEIYQKFAKANSLFTQFDLLLLSSDGKEHKANLSNCLEIPVFKQRYQEIFPEEGQIAKIDCRDIRGATSRSIELFLSSMRKETIPTSTPKELHDICVFAQTIDCISVAKKFFTMAHKDPITQVNFYMQFAAESHPQSLFYLGECFEKGIGVRRNTEQANFLFERAAKLGVRARSKSHPRGL